MPSPRLFTPSRRALLVAVVALVLVTGPLWSAVFHVGDPSHRYESTEVTLDSEHGYSYVDESGLESNHLLSDQIGCSSSRTERICTLERVVLDESVSTGRYTPNPDYRRSTSGIERYRYVLIDGQTYETSYVANQSVTRNGEYRIDLSLEPIPREDVLRAVSLDATRSTVSPVVRTAATAGTASTHEYIDVPETPVRLADGTYHRVYHVGWMRASGTERFLGWALTYLAPFVGIALLARVASRVEVTYVGR
jgi:hypothetical protein